MDNLEECLRLYSQFQKTH